MRHLRELLALGLLAVAVATVLPEAGWNATAHYALVESLAEGTPRIDGNLNQGGDIAWVDGHFYAAKAPGLAMASVPLYAVLDASGAVRAQEATDQGPPGAESVVEEAIWQVNLVVVAAFLTLLVLVRAAADRVSAGTGAPVALILGLTTMLLPFATAYFSHVLSATLGFAAFALVARRRSRSAAALVGAGSLAGLAVVAELPLALVAAALGLYVIADMPRLRRGALYALGFAFGLLPLLAYNTWAFGAPWRTGYSNAVLELGESGHDVIGANDEGLFGLTYPRLDRALDVLVSERGLFVLTPIVVVALAGLPLLARRGHRREAALVGGLVLAFLLYNASYYLPLGGHTPGPRFLVPILPFLALPLAAALRRWPLLTLAGAILSAFWMVSATLAGALLPPAESPTTWLGDVASGGELVNSILGRGRPAELAFAVPALAALALVALPYARSRATTTRGADSLTSAKPAARNSASGPVHSSPGSEPSPRG